MKLSLNILAALVAISLCRQTSAAIFNPNDVASLIAAINTSNSNGVDDTIELATNGTYTLTAVDNSTHGPNGLPVIGYDTGHKLVIHGNGATLQRSTAGGTPAFRIFYIDVAISGQTILPADLTISGLTITNGNVTDSSGGDISGLGGGIFNDGTLTVTNSTLSGNSATAVGSGISGLGGGIFNTGTLTVTNSTLSGNSATGVGSGIGGLGGGIFNDLGTVTVTNSTMSGNSATAVGGAFGGLGGGIYNLNGGATLTIGDTILNAGASGANIVNERGTITSHGYNLSSDDGGGFLTGPVDQINTAPMLGPLQNNGGPTFTHALLVGSPAINMGNPNFTPPPDYDQRGPGYPRVVSNRIDIGAFEVQQGPTPTPTATATATPSPAVTTNPATNVASVAATLNGSVNPRGSTTTVRFQYGPTTSYGHTTATQTRTGNTSLPITANISGLSASHLYHFRIVATNGGGTSFGPDRTFTTTGPPSGTTNPATNVARSSARLNGSVNPHGLRTTVRFQYGRTTSYGSRTLDKAKTGNNDQNVFASIAGLSAHTTYHFRIVATNSVGTRYGSDRTFTTQ